LKMGQQRGTVSVPRPVVILDALAMIQTSSPRPSAAWC
jgi:hypothetical protein